MSLATSQLKSCVDGHIDFLRSAQLQLPPHCALGAAMSAGTASLLGLGLLMVSHHLYVRPPGWFGAVPITGQTLVICINALLLSQATSTLLLTLYILLGMLPAPGTKTCTLGPNFTRTSTGYIAGFIPGALVVANTFEALLANHTPALLAAFAASVAGQLLVLGFGTVWLIAVAQMEKREAILTGAVPFLPGVCSSLSPHLSCIISRASPSSAASLHSYTAPLLSHVLCF